MRRVRVVCAVLTFLCTFSWAAKKAVPTLINGTDVPEGTWQEVVSINTRGDGCTATIVGPRAIVTAAHCGANGLKSVFTFKGTRYEAVFNRSPRYPNQDHDIAIGVLSSDIAGASPIKIGGVPKKGDAVTLFGYGCTRPDGSGGNNGKLRMGDSSIFGFSAYDIVSRTPGGAVLCFGDSGGPTVSKITGTPMILAVNSKTNFASSTSYSTQLVHPDSIAFLKDISAKNGNLVICGVTSECGDPPPPDPTCRLTANPSTVTINQSFSLVLNAENATSAEIDGTPANVPTSEKRMIATGTGRFTKSATVRNAVGRTATCSADYTVEPENPGNRPGCTITAVPSVAKIGETVTLNLATTGNVTEASIDGNPVQFPLGKFNIARLSVGQYAATGFAKGPGGSVNCFTDYRVTEAPPPMAEFILTPTFCGENQFPESGVKSACLALVKTDPSWTMTAKEILLLNHTDRPLEAMITLASTPISGGAGPGQTANELVNFGNALNLGGLVPVLNTRNVTMVQAAGGGAPLSLKGRSSHKGRLFSVPKLSLSDVHSALPPQNDVL